jgi:formamidopyrimidine-DNA glycosylase
MPELPEVEIARRNLDRWIGGKTVSGASLDRLVGKRVREVERRGKWLRLALPGEAALFSHLGMTGKWVKRATSDGPQRWERARIDAGRVSVRFVDPRRFGRLMLALDGRPPRAFAELGPDPLVDGIDAKRLAEKLARTKRSIKETLLDQTLLAGVGNIQAAEALWRAKISPRLAANRLARDPKRVRTLAAGILASIRYTLGASTDPEEIEYVEEPGAPNPFRVYGKANQPCPRCRTKIRRIVQGGRSTFYCPHCQR